MTFTIYASVASSKVIKACFVNSHGRLLRNSSANIPERTTSWCSILQTVQTNTLVDHGGYLLQAEMNGARSSLRIPAVCYTISWLSVTVIWYECTYIQLHVVAYSCCFQFYDRFLIVHPWSYFWWPYWQYCCELTRVCFLAMCRRMTYWV
jgi:hypothetical protein